MHENNYSEHTSKTIIVDGDSKCIGIKLFKFRIQDLLIGNEERACDDEEWFTLKPN